MDIVVPQLDANQTAIVAGVVVIVVLLFLISRISMRRKPRLVPTDCFYGHHQWAEYKSFGRPAGMRCSKCGKKCPDSRHVAQDVVDASGQRRTYCTVCGKELTHGRKR